MDLDCRPHIQDFKQAIASELALVDDEEIRLYSSNGQELIDDEDLNMLPRGGYVFFTLHGMCEDEPFNYKNCIVQYEMIRPLGEGGFGKVMLAKDKITGEQVAIKFMRCDLSCTFPLLSCN